MTDSQIIVSDAYRLAYWNAASPDGITKGKAYDGYFGDFGSDEKFKNNGSNYERISVGKKYLWAISKGNDYSKNTIERYILPVKQGDRPIEKIILRD